MEREMEERLLKIEKDLSSVSKKLLKYFSPSELAESEFRSLRKTLMQQGIVLFSRQLRSLVGTRNQEIPTDQRTLYWELIDAIGFWEDAHPGRWPYTTNRDFTRRLQWANEISLRMRWEIHTNEVYYAGFLPPGAPIGLLGLA